MFGYNNVRVETICISDPAGDLTIPIWRAPSACAHIEILDAWAVVDTTVTLGDGTGIALTLLDYGTAGAGNVGTVTSILGGTAVTWTASTLKAFTISEGTFTGGNYLALYYNETGTVAPKNLIVCWSWREGNSA